MKVKYLAIAVLLLPAAAEAQYLGQGVPGYDNGPPRQYVPQVYIPQPMQFEPAPQLPSADETFTERQANEAIAEYLAKQHSQSSYDRRD